MKYRYPLPLYHSWPLRERAGHFALGHLHDAGTETGDRAAPLPGGPSPGNENSPLPPGVGQWHCRLSDNKLSWSPTVFDQFGVPRGAALKREDIVALYAEPSRAAMERLRAHAISHRRGFTIDVEIRPDRAQSHWIRLIAAPQCADGRIVGLHGLKILLPPKKD
ncbi:hypothetical protein [Sphingopyxis sp. MWB1]|uniref:hypothetical protein n=1 Tax=Sphingopyxis sp. MWB1 TaxID=1537715 RepID=UPI00051A7647|nr:hypothetical protein [Sphingopyxis sp. MWB1]